MIWRAAAEPITCQRNHIDKQCLDRRRADPQGLQLVKPRRRTHVGRRERTRNNIITNAQTTTTRRTCTPFQPCGAVAMSATWTQTRARLAQVHALAKSQGRLPDRGEVAELRQLLKCQRLEQRLIEAITHKPTLTARQYEHLASGPADRSPEWR